MPTPASIARRAEVWGHPIAHSLSPQLHQAAYAALGLSDWSYGRRDVEEDRLAAEFAALDDSFAGVSLTMPLKTAIVPLLDRLDPLAAQLGVVNTVVFQWRDGQREAVGYNTDVYGIEMALGEPGNVSLPSATHGDEGSNPRARATAGPASLTASVLGSGATALSAIAALPRLGVREALLMTRTPERADDARRLAQMLEIELRPVSWSEAGDEPREVDLAISTLPAQAASAIVQKHRSALPRPRLGALDVAYPADPIGAAWREGGADVAPGTEMLLHQARRQVELMTGRTPPLAAMRAALVPRAASSAPTPSAQEH